MSHRLVLRATQGPLTLATMQSFFNVDLTMTTYRLVEVRKNYFIPPKYELHVPLPRERSYDAFPCGFGLSTDALEARLRFSLHLMIEACLERVLLGSSQRILRERCAFQQQRLEVTFFLHFLPPGVEFPDQVDLWDGE
ncbi:hypothetical protein BHE74_00015531 [Ensete ventricosum]|nr:hypothetical protein BHE74_00015531 [Ensete ventricosum]